MENNTQLQEIQQYFPTAAEVDKIIATIRATVDRAKAEDTLAKISNIIIASPDQAVEVKAILTGATAHAKTVEEWRKKITAPVNKDIDKLNAEFYELFKEGEKQPASLLGRAISLCKQKIMAYDNEIRRKIAEEEAKLRAEAAERERKEREKLEARAVKAEASGKTEKAEELRQKAEEVNIQAPVLAAPKSTMSYRTDYDFEVVDKSLVPEDYKIVDEVMLRRVVKAQKELCKIPGIKIVTRQVPISR